MSEDIQQLPSDPAILLSFINMKLRDQYPAGLDSLCDDMGIDKNDLVKRLADAGFEYSADNNRFW